MAGDLRAKGAEVAAPGLGRLRPPPAAGSASSRGGDRSRSGRAGQPARTGGALTADFKRFWAGQTVSQLGSSFTLFAIPLLVFKLTHSAVNLGISTAANFLPYLLFGLLI